MDSRHEQNCCVPQRKLRLRRIEELPPRMGMHRTALPDIPSGHPSLLSIPSASPRQVSNPTPGSSPRPSTVPGTWPSPSSTLGGRSNPSQAAELLNGVQSLLGTGLPSWAQISLKDRLQVLPGGRRFPHPEISGRLVNRRGQRPPCLWGSKRTQRGTGLMLCPSCQRSRLHPW